TRFDAACERRHMAVGGLIAVIVLEADVFAVAGFPAGLLHRTIAGGVDRRAQRGGPIQARMHLGVAKDRIAARTEAGSHYSLIYRLSGQGIFIAPSPLISKNDNTLAPRHPPVI